MTFSTHRRAPGTQPNRWAVLALLGVAQPMVVLDATIVNIALPSAQAAILFGLGLLVALLILPSDGAARARTATAASAADQWLALDRA